MRLNRIIQFAPSDVRCFQNAIQYIRSKYPKYVSAEHLSVEYGMDVRKLQQGFKKETGATIHQYQIQQRLRNAITDLENLDFTIKDVTFRNGFKNSNQFRKFLKKQLNKSPLEHRTEVTNKNNHLLGTNQKPAHK